MIFKVKNIKWDIDNDLTAEELMLPTETIVQVAFGEDEIADVLSDEYGWCVLSFETDGIVEYEE